MIRYFSPAVMRLSLISVFGLVSASCSKPAQDDVPVEYVIPKLGTAAVGSITLQSHEGVTELENRGGLWWVKGSPAYPADKPSVERLLRILADMEIAKQVQVVPADLPRLMLDKGGGGVGVTLVMSDGEKIEIVLGSLDFPQDMSAAPITGAAALARRFVRVVGSTDQIYLVPTSIADLSTASAYWTERRICRIPSFRRLIIRSDGKVAREYFRERPFGALQVRSSGQAKRVNDSVVKDFEFFLAYGLCEGVAADSQGISEHSQNRAGKVVVEDFLGLSYSFILGHPLAAGIEETERAELRAGILSNGVASRRVPMMLTVSSVADAGGDRIARSLRDENIEIGERLYGRVFYANYEFCAAIIRELEEP